MGNDNIIQIELVIKLITIPKEFPFYTTEIPRQCLGIFVLRKTLPARI